MKVIIDDSARHSMDSIFHYNLKYSLKYATETDSDIKFCINDLADFSYTGRYIPEISDKHFREVIYKKTRHSCYRIIYYISEISSTAYVLNVLNTKQDFKKFLKLHNYFKNYFRF